MPDIKVTLGPSSPDQDHREVLEALGAGGDEQLARTITHLIENEPRMLEILSQRPEDLRAFALDPWEVIRREFPDLETPRAAKPVVGAGEITLETVPVEGAPNPGLDLLKEVWEFVSLNGANTESFKLDPFAVVASVGAGSPPEVVDQVNRALETVLGIYRIAPITPTVEAVMSTLRNRPR